MIKILGIGSPYGDDKVGWMVIDNILKEQEKFKNNIPNRLVIEKHDRPGMHLLELMRGAYMVYLVDAVISSKPIGTIHKLYKNEIKELKSVLTTHDVGIAQALEIGEAISSLPKEIIFYGVEIDFASISTNNLSSLVEIASQEVARRINIEITSMTKI